MLTTVATACGFGGVNSLPLPGTVGHGAGASTYTVELLNVGTLEPNSPVLMNDVVVGSVRRIGVVDRHAEVEITIVPGVHVPADATAAVGQTSLLGSMNLQLTAPNGQRDAKLQPGSVIPLERSSAYPSTEQTLAALSTVVNAGGLGQIGDIVHSLNNAFSGRTDDIRELMSNLDTFVGTLDDQREDIISTVSELNRFAGTLAQQRDTLATALREIQPALDILREQRPALTAALDALRTFSDTATKVVADTKADLVTNLGHLGPVLAALNDIGPDIATALAFATTFPLNQNLIDRGMRGDYLNLFVTVDLTLSRFRRGLLSGTSFADPNAPLVPAPGDPGYERFYSKNPLGEAVALPPGVMGPDRLPPETQANP
ncbi:MCE family protein [Mycobacterium sp. SMC-4]|uniref:MCE family protein n=1 Tax=Mycobacterium sp. SMC-4 TaxID=2857059 RepID=UPI0021B3F168|nr:MCE family protein [Mycobacterium sp. SMC-4]UXA20690.1 MCE family protein [Mycobacterium sp. SMC-4]